MRAYALRWWCSLSLPFVFLVISQTTLSAGESSKATAHARSLVAAKPSSSEPSKAMPMPLVVPLFVQDAHFTSTLVMVNGTDVSTFADVTVRDLSGKQITQRHVLFPPHSREQLDIGQVLFAVGSVISAGSLTVVQSPDLTGMSIRRLLVCNETRCCTKRRPVEKRVSCSSIASV
jgi:hypothetical protein